NRPERAAFSVILLGSDSRGVEIGFQSDTIFSQSPVFQVAESVTGTGITSLVTALTPYDLRIQGTTYTLSTAGSALRTGTVKDYSAQTGFGSDVYRSTNFVFTGDDTTSARGVFNLTYLSIETPEPSGVWLLFAGVALMLARRSGARTLA